MSDKSLLTDEAIIEILKGQIQKIIEEYNNKTKRTDLKKLFNKVFWESVSIVLTAGLLYIGLRLTIQSSVVDGPSMENTFQNGEKVLVDKLAYKLSTPQRGDVIIFHPTIPSTSPFINVLLVCRANG